METQKTISACIFRDCSDSARLHLSAKDASELFVELKKLGFAIDETSLSRNEVLKKSLCISEGGEEFYIILSRGLRKTVIEVSEVDSSNVRTKLLRFISHTLYSSALEESRLLLFAELQKEFEEKGEVLTFSHEEVELIKATARVEESYVHPRYLRFRLIQKGDL